MLSISSRRTPRRLATTAAVALSGLCLSACAPVGKGDVVVGFYPLEYLTSTIGGTEIKVQNLAQPGAEPHDMELTAQQIGSLSTASLVIYLKGLQPALDDAIKNEKPTHALDVATVAPLAEGYESLGHGGADDHEHESPDGHDHDHGAGGLDPHVWLDPKLMLKISSAVHDSLVKVSGKDKADYARNYSDLEAKLKKLDADYTAGLATCERKSIVTTHNAFGYLAKSYGLEQVGISGLTEQEPSPQKIAEVKSYVQTNGVTTIFFEAGASDKYATTIAAETGTQTAVLDPLEVKPGKGDYLSAMEDNLKALRSALGCL